MPRAYLKAVGLIVGLFFVLWLRRPDSLLNAQFWAEDGGVFFREQVVFGLAGTLIRPYSGYLHVIPRLTAALMCMLPVRWVPLGFNLCALTIEAICCGAFFAPCFRKIVESDLLRATCCLVVAASVAAGSELIGTLANVQWFLCILSLLLIFTQTRRMEIPLTVVQVCIAFSAPVTLLYLPFLLWQVKSNPKVLKARPALHAIALVTQALIMRHDVTGPRPVLKFNTLFVATLNSGLSRCVLSPLMGTSFLKDDSDVALVTKMALALILGVVLATLLCRSPRLKYLLAAGYVGVGSLLAILYGRGVEKSFLNMDGLRNYTAERYFFVGAALFVFLVATALDTFRHSRKPLIASAALAAMFAFGIYQNFQARTFDDLHWAASAAKIEQWEAARKRHEKVERLVVPINPPNFELVLD